MSEHKSRRVLIIGAGSMGIILGYHLSLAGVDVTFLVRAHRAEELEHPQALYCYNDNQLKIYSDYKSFTNPSEMVGTDYDYILITLDGASLRNEVGQDLVKTIGQAVLGTKAGVIIGAVFPELKPWFLEISRLPSEQVIIGTLYIHIYPTKRLKMPANPLVDPELIAKADFAYIDCLGPGLVVDNSSPILAERFASLYNASGVSRCDLTTPIQNALSGIPFFAVLAACELMDWPKFRDIDHRGQLWSLGVAAVREIQGLGVYGESGQTAAQATTEDGFAATLVAMENAMLPFDLQTFNRFHHGGKVNVQDRQILRACLNSGEANGKSMTALKELLRRVETHRVGASP